MAKKRGRPPPGWFHFLLILEDKKHYTTGELADLAGAGNRAIVAAFRRRGLRPVRRSTGEGPDNLWLGGAVKEAVSPPLLQRRLL